MNSQNNNLKSRITRFVHGNFFALLKGITCFVGIVLAATGIMKVLTYAVTAYKALARVVVA